MARKTITQKSPDNPYFHRDFYIALNYGIDYLHKKFVAIAVKEYLAQFANNYHVINPAIIEYDKFNFYQDQIPLLGGVRGGFFEKLCIQKS